MTSPESKRMPWVQDPKSRPLEEVLLLFVGERQGPMLDVLDITDFPALSVRDVILHFEKHDPPSSPAEVRAALQDLLEARHLAPAGLDRSGSCMEANSEVRLTCRGLVAARRLDPNCGRKRDVLTLRTRLGRPMLAARFDTGNPERDRALNASGTVLATAFVVLILEPTRQQPLIVDECMQFFERLDSFGVGRRSGPSSEKVASTEAVRSALDQLRQVLNVSRDYFGEDERRDYYYLSGPLPEVRIAAGDRRHYGDWQSYRRILWCVVMGQSLNGTPGWKESVFPSASKSGERKARAKPASGRVNVADAATGGGG